MCLTARTEGTTAPPDESPILHYPLPYSSKVAWELEVPHFNEDILNHLTRQIYLAPYAIRMRVERLWPHDNSRPDAPD